MIKFHVKIHNFICKRYFTSCLREMENVGYVAVCQLTSTNDKKNNLIIFKKLAGEAVQKGAKFLFFPEATDFVATNPEESLELAETLNGPLMHEYKQLAKDNNVWISIGGFHEKSTNFKNKLHNTHVIIDGDGEIKSVYRKLHLFDVTISEKNICLKESDGVLKGHELVPPVKTPVGYVGLSICYDLRFPESSTLLRKMGADLLTFPSAFTNTTGEHHWEHLLKARAIENQCYVVAAAQYGHHNAKRISHGHSMIIDPWGRTVAECAKYQDGKVNDESLAIASIDEILLSKIRNEMPVLSHRRNDVYNLNLIPNKLECIDRNQYKFAHISIPSSTVFYQSKYCYAFTNVRCVVPGHVLVSTLRTAKRLEDLSDDEAADLMTTVIKVQKIMEIVHEADSSTICIQDGKSAGQTIAHVHCHILPRKVNDFERNDTIYEELAKHDRENSINPPRDVASMEAEAENLRKYFS